MAGRRKTPLILFGLFGAVWLFFVGLMSYDYLLIDNPSRWAEGEFIPYGHNRAGNLSEMLIYMVVEITVLFLILRPLSYNFSWVRALLALILAVPLALVFLTSTMHAGFVIFTHAVWCLIMVVMLAVLLIASLHLRAQRKHAVKHL